MMEGLQKASLSKRLFATILDVIIIAILTTGFAYLTSLIVKIDDHQQKVTEYMAYYEETYDVKFNLKQEDFDKMSEEELQHYQEVEEIINHDLGFSKELNLIIYLTLIIILVGFLFGVMIPEFVIPLFLKNGQTIGKKIFSLVVIKNNSVKASTLQLFVRAFFGKFIIVFIVPAYIITLVMNGVLGWVWLLFLGALTLLQLILLVVTQNHTFIHDVFAYTVIADKQTQMIFESEEALLEYKKEKHKNEVSRKTY